VQVERENTLETSARRMLDVWAEALNMTKYLSNRAPGIFAVVLVAVASACAAPESEDGSAESSTALTPARDTPASSSGDGCEALGADARVAEVLAGCGVKGEKVSEKAESCFSTGGQDLRDTLKCRSCSSTKSEKVCSKDISESSTLTKEISLRLGSKTIVCPKGTKISQSTKVSASAQSSQFENAANGAGRDDAVTYYAKVVTVDSQSVTYDLDGCTIDGAAASGVSLSCNRSGVKYATTATLEGVACGLPIADDKPHTWTKEDAPLP